MSAPRNFDQETRDGVVRYIRSGAVDHGMSRSRRMGWLIGSSPRQMDLSWSPVEAIVELPVESWRCRAFLWRWGPLDAEGYLCCETEDERAV